LNLNSRDIAIVIPARLNSRRLRNKVMMKFNGLEMIEHVRRRAELNKHKIPVYVVSGDKKILELIQKYGGNVVQTYANHLNGFSRCIEAHKTLKYRRYILLQGDEILIDPNTLNEMASAIKRDSEKIYNAVTNLKSTKEINNRSVVKCLVSKGHNIQLMFRESPLTANNKLQISQVKKVCGLFGFTDKTLNRIGIYMPSFRAKNESIEQLSFLDNDIHIEAVPVPVNYPSVNDLKDVNLCNKILKSDKSQINIWKKIERRN
jgi:3-deoxy-manno-octulosonate cytidylyltransferase (CMP-KDO synthetase)